MCVFHAKFLRHCLGKFFLKKVSNGNFETEKINSYIDLIRF